MWHDLRASDALGEEKERGLYPTSEEMRRLDDAEGHYAMEHREPAGGGRGGP